MAGSPLKALKEIRARWYLQVDKYGKSIDEVCKIFGMSRKTYYKWRLKDFGPNDHHYQARRFHPNLKLKSHLCLLIHEAKLKYNYGPKKMKYYLKEKYQMDVSSTIIYRYFKKKRLIRKPQKKQVWYTPLKQRYTAINPGENVQLDVKYIPGGQTWHYQFRFIDTVTNIQWSTDMVVRDALATIAAFHDAERFFPFSIKGIQTDNGGEFRGRFHEYLAKREIVHRYIPKRSAPWNGKVERANRSIDDEYYLNQNKPWKTVAQYTHWYNHERPHEGKGMYGLTPYQKLQQYLIYIKPKVSPLNVN